MKITNREKEILIKLSEGLTVKEVANTLYIAPCTVETHKKHLYEKMNARTLVQLGAMAVRQGLILVFLLFYLIPATSQAQFEVEGDIKATGLSGSGDRILVADEDGKVKMGQQDAAIFEIKDSTGDVRFRFDANSGMFLSLLDGDTMRFQEVRKFNVNQQNLGSKLDFQLKQDVIETDVDFVDQIYSMLAVANLKIPSGSFPTAPVIHGLYPDKMFTDFDDGEHIISWQAGDNDFFAYSKDGEITEIGVDDYENFLSWSFHYENGMLAAIELFIPSPFGPFKQAFLLFDESCNLIFHVDYKMGILKGISPDEYESGIYGPNLVSEKIGPGSNGEKSWFGINNAIANFGAENAENQVAGGPDFFNIFNQVGDVVQQLTYTKDKIQAVKDDDANDPENPLKVVELQFDTDNNEFVFCGDIRVKGEINATGDINANVGAANVASNAASAKHNYQWSEGGVATTNQDGSIQIKIDHFSIDGSSEIGYQLTTIGSFSKAIISRELKDGWFEISTEDPNVKVSWEISRIRQNIGVKEKALTESNHVPIVRYPSKIQSPKMK